MSLSKINKALFRAKYGDQLYDAMIAAENVIVTDDGVEKSLADVILTVALKSELPTKVSDLTNDSAFQTDTQVANAINAKIASVYKPGGSYAFESLPALTEANEGFVYNVTNDFTTTADFLEGAGKKHKAGADVGIVAVKDGQNTVYKYNVFANFVDLSGYQEKVANATTDDIATLNASGQVVDSGKKLTDFVEKETGKGLSTNDYDATEKQKVADAYAAIHSHTNKTVLDGITADKVLAWDAAGRVYVSDTQPSGLKNGDLWLQTFSA